MRPLKMVKSLISRWEGWLLQRPCLALLVRALWMCLGTRSKSTSSVRHYLLLTLLMKMLLTTWLSVPPMHQRCWWSRWAKKNWLQGSIVQMFTLTLWLAPKLNGYWRYPWDGTRVPLFRNEIGHGENMFGSGLSAFNRLLAGYHQSWRNEWLLLENVPGLIGAFRTITWCLTEPKRYSHYPISSGAMIFISHLLGKEEAKFRFEFI